MSFHNNIKRIIKIPPLTLSSCISRGSSGGLSFHDDSGETSKVVKDVLKILLSSLWGNSISMPIRIYEPRSFLERITDPWLHFSHYLSLASAEKDSLERFLLVIRALVSGFYRAFVSQKQPFNPTLGETAHVVLECGLECFMEQISHHPPITQYEAIDPKKHFECYGKTTVHYKLGMRGVTGNQTGVNYVRLLTEAGPEIEYSYVAPGIQIDGLVSRSCRFTKNFELKGDGLVCRVEFNPNKKTIAENFPELIETEGEAKLLEGLKDFMCGKIYRVKGKKKEGRRSGKESLECLGVLYGSWLDELFFNEKSIWKIGEHALSVSIAKEKNDKLTLPSDSQNRCDVIHLENKNFPEAQKGKLMIEKRQRSEAKLRKGKK